MRAWIWVALCLTALPLAASHRVITTSPSLSEIMLDLGAGDDVVGILDAGLRPEALAGVPSVGRMGKIELETLLVLQPDLILLLSDSLPAGMPSQLQQFGLQTYVVNPSTLDQLAEHFIALGQRIGRAEQGQNVADEFRQGVAKLREQYRTDKPLRVFYQVWNKPLYTLGGRQILTDALSVCGAENIFADLPQPAPQVNFEAVLARQPEVILASQGSELTPWLQWESIPAVRDGRLVTVPDPGVERPSFQMLAALDQLCQALHGTSARNGLTIEEP